MHRGERTIREGAKAGSPIGCRALTMYLSPLLSARKLPQVEVAPFEIVAADKVGGGH
jgi:hypothetical protein